VDYDQETSAGRVLGAIVRCAGRKGLRVFADLTHPNGQPSSRTVYVRLAADHGYGDRIELVQTDIGYEELPLDPQAEHPLPDPSGDEDELPIIGVARGPNMTAPAARFPRK
jgi:hypothetical protein